MILLTQDLRECLLANGRHGGLDHAPVVKFFNPLGVGTWLRPSSMRTVTHCSVSPISANPSSAASASVSWGRWSFLLAWESSATSCSKARSRCRSMRGRHARQDGSCSTSIRCALRSPFCDWSDGNAIPLLSLLYKLCRYAA
jgi:hypothetical protein